MRFAPHLAYAFQSSTAIAIGILLELFVFGPILSKLFPFMNSAVFYGILCLMPLLILAVALVFDKRMPSFIMKREVFDLWFFVWIGSFLSSLFKIKWYIFIGLAAVCFFGVFGIALKKGTKL